MDFKKHPKRSLSHSSLDAQKLAIYTCTHTRVMSNIKKRRKEGGTDVSIPEVLMLFDSSFPTLKGLASVHSKAIFEIEMIANKEAAVKAFFPSGRK